MNLPIDLTFIHRTKAEVVSSEESSPYLDKVRERAKTADRSLSIEEFLARVDEVDRLDESIKP